MRELPRRLRAEAEALGLDNVRIEWNRHRPRIVGHVSGTTIIQSFSFTAKDWNRAYRNAITALRRKTQAARLSSTNGDHHDH